MLSKKEKLLIVKLLKMASDEFSNHGCNDFVITDYEWSLEESNELHKKIAMWNDPNCIEEDIDEVFSGPYHSDWLLMEYFADKLLEEIDLQ